MGMIVRKKCRTGSNVEYEVKSNQIQWFQIETFNVSYCTTKESDNIWKMFSNSSFILTFDLGLEQCVDD